MEVLSAAASVAGLVSLLGQCIGGAEKLCSFCEEVKLSSHHAEQLIQDAKLMVSTLNQGKDLIERIHWDPGLSGVAAHLISLHAILKDCGAALAASESIISSARRQKCGKWWETFCKAISHASRDGLHDQLQRHRTQISAQIAMIHANISVSTAQVTNERHAISKTTNENLTQLQASFGQTAVSQSDMLTLLKSTVDDLSDRFSSSEESNRSTSMLFSSQFDDLKSAIARRSDSPLLTKSKYAQTVDQRLLLK